MHPWLSHLLADIANAHAKEIPSQQKQPQSFEDYIREVEDYLHGPEPEHTMSYYCGLQSINFPPADQFTDEELAQICDAFHKMLYSWNHGIDLPEKLPIAFVYKMMVNALDEKTNITDSGIMSFDYCSGYAPDCVFKDYCSCLEIWNSDDDEDEVEEDFISGPENVK